MNLPKIPWLASFYLIIFFIGIQVNDIILNNGINPTFWENLLIRIIVDLIAGLIILTTDRNFHFKYPNSYVSSFYFVSTIILQLYFGVNKTEKWQIEFMLFAIINLGIMSLFLKKGNIESN